ncbi:MAG: 2-C-methyl-D-erythritol 4-phosphate cytidylyltransferase [Prevotella sp.]
MNVAVILAGGSGTRVGGDKPKQFIEVAGKTVIQHTIEAFSKNRRIDEIAIVTKEDYVDEVRDMVERERYGKVRHVLKGGKERYHSSLAALSAYTDDNARLLFHDAVRPLVTQRIIDDCIDALDTCEAVEVAVPATDTIIEVDSEGNISRIPPRSRLRNVQTPQGFRRGVIAEAFRKALEDKDFSPTDDCSVVFRYMPETKIRVIDGDTKNIKITYREDLEMAARTLAGRE